MKGNDGKLEDKDKFSSLVLESALRNTKHTARTSSPGLWMFGGGNIADKEGTFDTAKNLRELAQLDKELPVNLISGTKHMKGTADTDHLSLNTTKLDKLAEENFTNVRRNQIQADHMDGSKLEQSWDVIQDNLSRKKKG